MPQKAKIYLRGIVALLFVIFVIIFLTKFSAVSAEKDLNFNPTSCEFQPPVSDRSSTINSIRDTEDPKNKTWDNTFPGLHRWNEKQWPGVDYLVPTTTIFRNGGNIFWRGWDSAGGGWSIKIEGIGECEGWLEFIGHLDYNPATRFSEGQFIGPDEVIGLPGCSGFESDCTLNGGTLPPHNHTTIGYTNNVFIFEDGTQIDFVGEHWWVHPSRLEGENPNGAVKARFIFKNAEEDKITIGFSNKTINAFFALLIITTIFGAFFIPQFRVKAVMFLIIATMLFFGFPKAKDVIANSMSKVFTSPEEKSISFSVKNTDEIVETGNGECSLPDSYPAEILQWCSLIEEHASLNGLDPKLIAALILQESGGNPNAYSKSGAVGLMQVMPKDGIAASFVNAEGVPYFSNRPSMAELYDPAFNIEYGTRFLAGLIGRYGGNVRDGLKSYGPANCDYYYADIVLAIYERNK